MAVNERAGIEVGDEFAAAHEELVNGVLRGVGNILGIDDHEDLDIVSRQSCSRSSRLPSYVEIGFEFADENPWRRCFAKAGRIAPSWGLPGLPKTGSAAHDADDRVYRVCTTREMARERSYSEKALAFGIEERNGFLAIEQR